jgi:low affinity Fe/Cu permease
MTLNERGSTFARFASRIARIAGRPTTFVVALLVVVGWLATRPLFASGDTWQLVINTATTIVTFLMVFLIQNSQNRDTEALQVKLDELLRATEGAHNALLDLEELDEQGLDAIRAKYGQLARKAREDLQRGRPDTGRPKVGPTGR